MALLRLELQRVLIGLAIPLLLVLLAVVLVAVVAIQRSMKKGEDKGGGADIVPYLVLALAMGVATFALASLMSTAFPGDRFVFDPADNLATALAALVVSLPFVVYFWRRQADRRVTYPQSVGWTVYLTLVELVLMTAFVVSAVLFVNGIFSDESANAWTGALVFGAVVVFHEMAALRTPPRSDAGELQRVIGSAVGLITGVLGLIGTLIAIFTSVLNVNADFEIHPWLAMLVVGAPLWAYRWLRSWDPVASIPRLVWLVVVTTASVAVWVGGFTALLIWSVQYVVGDPLPAGDHFEGSPVALALLLVGLLVWLVHRRLFGAEMETPLRVHQYATSAIGLVTAVSGAISLTIFAFDDSQLVGGSNDDVLAFAIVTLVGVAVWQVFTRRAVAGEAVAEEATWPRRIYHLGLGVVFGLTAAGALISTLFILLRRLLDGDTSSGVLIPATIFGYTALVAWYLLSTYSRERVVGEPEERIEPFDVTIITSHPGLIADRFPRQARLQVIHRGDEAGAIDEETADAIVAAVGHRSSLVWVDADGFRVAPKRAVT